MNKYTWIAIIALSGLALAAAACENTSGLDEAPRATFAQLAYLDVNNDDRINGADGADPSLLSDFNADDDRDAEDAAFVEGIDIPLDPAFDTANCEGEGDDSPEYLVAHGYFSPSDVSCDDGEAV